MRFSPPNLETSLRAWYYEAPSNILLTTGLRILEYKATIVNSWNKNESFSFVLQVFSCSIGI